MKILEESIKNIELEKVSLKKGSVEVSLLWRGFLISESGGVVEEVVWIAAVSSRDF